MNFAEAKQAVEAMLALPTDAERIALGCLCGAIRLAIGGGICPACDQKMREFFADKPNGNYGPGI